MQTELLLGEDVQKVSPMQQRTVQQTHQKTQTTLPVAQKPQPQKTVTPIQVFRQPVIQGAIDLRRASVGGSTGTGEENLSTKELLVKYKTFLVFSAGLVVCLIVAIFFLRQVMVDERDFDIQIQDDPISAGSVAEMIET